MTGSKPQLYNGIALLATFFLCRLVWGTWQSAVVYVDMWHALFTPPSKSYLAAAFANSTISHTPDTNPMFFARDGGAAKVPLWLTGMYLASNLVLNGLNWYWFVKMVAAVRKRFEPPKQQRGKVAVPAAGAGAAAEVPRTTAAEAKEAAAVRQRRRAPSIVDVVPDSDDLREGTIQ
jgi:hypothetical protein